ncbi:MAG: ABC transporter permease [Gemmatimonadales bacterium]|jgi:putative ABC transport system permease protein
MPITEALRIALNSIAAHKLRSFFTLLGIIVSVAFLVAVVAIIQGMNAYVSEKLAGAIVGTNAFQIRRQPIAVAQLDDEEWREIQQRPLIDEHDAEFVRRALPDAQAIAMQSGFPTPLVDVHWSNRTVGDVLIFGVTAPYQVVQDYRFTAGEPLSDIDVRERRYKVVLGWDVADKLFGNPSMAIGQSIRVGRLPVAVKGVTEKKGTVLGQSFDGFVLLPFSTFESVYGRRQTITISVKMPPGFEIDDAMQRGEEAMRIARQLRPGEPNNFAVDKADALVEFWTNLTQVLFTVIPAVVAIGLIVGGIVIMNIMLMTVRERTREIGIRKSLGARRRDIRRQFLSESVTLACIGGALGVLAGWALATLISVLSPLPARVTPWSVSVALALGATIGIVFGVYPATRAARLDPVVALRQE